VSLLIDALGKAEQARQRAGVAAAPIDAPAATAATSTDAQQRNAFAAKSPPLRRRVALLALAIFAITASGLLAYFWWQLPTVSGSQRPTPPQTLAPETAATPTPTAAASIPASTTPSPTAASPQPSTAPRAAASATPSAPRTRPTAAATKVAAATPTSPLRLQKSSAPTPLERAYDELQTGRLDAAQRDYELVLRGDAKNTDALLGLATIAARQGQNELAQSYYLRALESDPNDATAQAGLSNTHGQGDPGLAESRLKNALASQPESAALHFALGNLYSRQRRWSEAQQAYFRAYAAEPDNADVIFNLAVSLDHLRQNKLAAQYYAMAIDGSRAQRAAFDAQQVRQRILELQP
jgi:Tfp pilus assembly protein PilF